MSEPTRLFRSERILFDNHRRSAPLTLSESDDCIGKVSGMCGDVHKAMYRQATRGPSELMEPSLVPNVAWLLVSGIEPCIHFWVLSPAPCILDECAIDLHQSARLTATPHREAARIVADIPLSQPSSCLLVQS